VPDSDVLILLIVGDNKFDEKLPGPVQLYVASGWLLVPVNEMVCPEHTGLFELVVMIGAIVELIDTVVFDVETHPL
jgi:hypothetical protein